MLCAYKSLVFAANACAYLYTYLQEVQEVPCVAASLSMATAQRVERTLVTITVANSISLSLSVCP